MQSIAKDTSDPPTDKLRPDGIEHAIPCGYDITKEISDISIQVLGIHRQRQRKESRDGKDRSDRKRREKKLNTREEGELKWVLQFCFLL